MNKKGVLFSVLAAAAVVSAGVFYFSRPAFNADALVKNSELGRQGVFAAGNGSGFAAI